MIFELLFTAALAQATDLRQTTPATGDVARFEGAITDANGKTHKFFREQTIGSGLGGDPSGIMKWQMQRTEIIDGVLNVSYFDSAGIDTFYVLQHLEKCQWQIDSWIYQRPVEDLTVPLGTYKACHIQVPDQDGNLQDYWLADVPFGFIKFEVKRKDGSAMSFVMTSHQENWSTKVTHVDP